MIASGGSVDLAKWIIDDMHVLSILPRWLVEIHQEVEPLVGYWNPTYLEEIILLVLSAIYWPYLMSP